MSDDDDDSPTFARHPVTGRVVMLRRSHSRDSNHALNNASDSNNNSFAVAPRPNPFAIIRDEGTEMASVSQAAPAAVLCDGDVAALNEEESRLNPQHNNGGSGGGDAICLISNSNNHQNSDNDSFSSVATARAALPGRCEGDNSNRNDNNDNGSDDDDENAEDVRRPEDLVNIDGVNDLSAVVAADGVMVCGCWVPNSILKPFILVVFLGIGVGLGLESMPSCSTTDPAAEDHSNCSLRALSAIIGWWYIFAWFLSFVPQITDNWKRRSVIGQSLDFVALNVLGFGCYSVYNLSLFYSSEVQRQYQHRFNSKNDVRINDVVFALLCFGCTVINGVEACFFERGGQVISLPTKLFIGVTCVIIVSWSVAIFAFQVHDDHLLNRLSLLYGLGVVKILVTIFKYPGQLIMNYRRKTTLGVAVENFSLDFAGGLMSTTQEVMDAALDDTWIELEGNLVKLSLGGISMFYDTIFMIQHWCVYNRANKRILAAFESKRRLANAEQLQESASSSP